MRVHFIIKIEETLTKDPHKVWQTLKNFDYPKKYALHKVFFYHFLFPILSFSSPFQTHSREIHFAPNNGFLGMKESQ